MVMEKIFTSLRSFTDDHHTGKAKFCATCGNVASQEAIFNVGDGVTLIEKCCDTCAKKIR
jgi:hypothetical protein